jgi:flagellar basal-body rod modification protein FlgD
MSTSALSATGYNPATANTPPGSSRIPQKALGQADFLKLLTVQLKSQDPMKPMEDTSFMAQMAQFSALQQSSQMATDISNLHSDFALQSASGMIGRQVTLNTKNGLVTGLVQSVDATTGTVNVNVDGTAYPLSKVVGVAPAPAPVAL